MSELRDGLVELYARYQSTNELRAVGLPVPSAEDDLRGLLADLADLAGIRNESGAVSR